MVKHSARISAFAGTIKEKTNELPVRRSARSRSKVGLITGPINVTHKLKSPSQSKSPLRKKSRDRSKSQRKVSERPKSVTRKSQRSQRAAKPSAENHLKNHVTTTANKNKKIYVEKSDEVDKISKDVVLEHKPRLRTRIPNRFNSVEKTSNLDDIKVNSINNLRNYSKSQSRDEGRIIHLAENDMLHKDVSEFSDKNSSRPETDESDFLQNNSVTNEDAKIKNDYILIKKIGVDYGLILYTFILSILMFAFFLSCYKTTCNAYKFTINIENIHISLYRFLKVFGYYSMYVLSIVFLSLVPWGRKIDSLPGKEGKFTYVMNGIFTALIFILLIVTSEYKQLSITKIIINNFQYLSMASMLVALLIGIIAKIRSFFIPISSLDATVVGRSGIYTFLLGSETHPRCFRIDWKIICFRLIFVTKVILDCSYLHNILSINIQDFVILILSGDQNILTNYHATVIVYFLSSLLFYLDGLYFEHALVTTREIQQEAFGYCLSATYLLRPFVASCFTNYIYYNNIELPYSHLLVSTGLFLLGYVVYRQSNNRKDAFRKSPYGQDYSRLDVIPTIHGRKLICTGYWGFVRHPNYLGRIFIELSVLPFIIKSPLVLIVLVNILFLIDRARKDNRRCSQKYGVAWDRYCNKVQYLLFPNIY